MERRAKAQMISTLQGVSEENSHKGISQQQHSAHPWFPMPACNTLIRSSRKSWPPTPLSQENAGLRQCQPRILASLPHTHRTPEKAASCAAAWANACDASAPQPDIALAGKERATSSAKLTCSKSRKEWTLAPKVSARPRRPEIAWEPSCSAAAAPPGSLAEPPE
jgi:hypothetical protein